MDHFPPTDLSPLPFAWSWMQLLNYPLISSCLPFHSLSFLPLTSPPLSFFSPYFFFSFSFFFFSFSFVFSYKVSWNMLLNNRVWTKVSSVPVTFKIESPILTSSQILGIYWTAKLISYYRCGYNHLKLMESKIKHSVFTFEHVPPHVSSWWTEIGF